MQMDMIGIFTDRIDDMKQFYADALGLRIVEDLGKYVEFEGASIRFAICERQVMSETVGDSTYDQPHTGHAFELAFKCDSEEKVNQAYQDLIDKGAQPIKSTATMPWGQQAGFFADPDDNIHEVFARLSE